MSKALSPEQENSTPDNASEAILTVFEDNPDLLRKAFNSERGYCEEVVQEMESRWGPEIVPSSREAYVATVKCNKQDYLRDILHGKDEEPETSVAELSTTTIEDFDPTSTEERCQAVVLSDDDFIRAAAENNLDFEEVKDAVTEEFGLMFQPTVDSVRSAVADLRVNGRLPSITGGLMENNDIQEIWYYCELCGESARSYNEISRHIVEETDVVHDGANVASSISIEGEELVHTDSIFQDSDFQGNYPNAYRVFEAIFHNPEARQKDIGLMLGMDQSNVSRILSEHGIEWEYRETDIAQLLSAWNSGIKQSVGNASYEGPETGVDTTSGRGTRSITDRPELQEEVTITLTKKQAREVLCKDELTPVKTALLNELIN